MRKSLSTLLLLLFFLYSCRSTAYRKKPPEYNKYVEKFFNSPDEFIQKTVIPNIDKNRKTDFQLQFVSRTGEPSTNLQVTAVLNNHDYLFGCSPVVGKNPNPKAISAWKGIFNSGIPENLFKWRGLEYKPDVYSEKDTDKFFSTYSETHLVFEFHFLTGYHPSWLNEIPEEERGDHQKEHVLTIIEKLKNKIKYWQVYNEIDYATQDRSKVYFNASEFFKQLTKKYPDLSFGVNDCWQLDEPLPSPEDIKDKYPGIKFLAIHAHKPRMLWASPEQIYKTLGPYINSGIKIHITEWGLFSGKIEGGIKKGQWNDDKLAEYIVSLQATCFSHPAVELFNQWGLGPNIKRFKASSLLYPDYSPRPAYKALKDLIKNKLSTHIEGRSDKQGYLNFRGFQGDYSIFVRNAQGKKASIDLKLNSDNRKYKLIVEKNEKQSLIIHNPKNSEP